MPMRKKGFTLIEIILAIVIIGSILTLGMRLNRKQVQDIKSQTITEEAISFFDTLFLQINASNYNHENIYSGLIVKLKKNTTTIEYEYLPHKEEHHNLSGSFLSSFTITELIGDTEGNKHKPISLKSATITYEPFKVDCTITGDGDSSLDEVGFSLLSQKGSQTCFKINRNYCRLQAIPCKDTF